MHSRHTRAAAAAAALVAAGLAVFALRPSSTRTATLAAANPPAEVRTVVIRRTIHIVRHKPVTGAAGSSGPGYAGRGSHSYASSAAGGVRTHVSGSHAISGAAPTTYSATTRTSPGHSGTSYSSGSSSAPVTSRTSSHGGSTHSGSGSGRPVTSRTSSHGGSGGTVKTRSSGGGEKGDGGGD